MKLLINRPKVTLKNDLTLSRIIIDLTPLLGYTPLTQGDDSVVVTELPTLEQFIEFILDGCDDELKPKSTHMVDHYRACFLLKTESGGYFSQLGTELLMVRNRVIAHIREQVDNSDTLEFTNDGMCFVINIHRTERHP